jgi:cell division septation protein DedD
MTATIDIRKTIADLLVIHDCVIIPGFGGFIGNYSPARVDPAYHTFYPPSKTLLFNVNLKQNDGLLANAIASVFRLPYNEAVSATDDFSDECRTLLRNNKAVVLPLVGTLTPGAEGIIHFEQDSVANLNADAFGLVPFVSPPVLRTAAAILSPDSPENRQGGKLQIRRALRWAAMLALPIGVATVIGITQYDHISSRISSNAGILNSVFTRFSSTSLVEKKSAPVRPATKSIPKPVILTPAPNPAPANTMSTADIRSNDRFAVIVGAFRMEENAEKLVNQLQSKGITARIFDQSKTGLYRVTIGTSSDRELARKLLASATSTDFRGAWILAK